MTKGNANRKIEAHIAKIKFHTAELISEVLRYNPNDPCESGQTVARKYDYLCGNKDILSHDGIEKSVTILDQKKLTTLLRFMGGMGMLKGEAYRDYLKKTRHSRQET